ncbi:hypothetical protein K1719_003340 [Acacia pycnantha]|nr:hypothetical protein K1719_003340 [Acacia pycnantha]
MKEEWSSVLVREGKKTKKKVCLPLPLIHSKGQSSTLCRLGARSGKLVPPIHQSRDRLILRQGGCGSVLSVPQELEPYGPVTDFIGDQIFRNYKQSWANWTKIPQDVRDAWFNEFLGKFKWLPDH